MRKIAALLISLAFIPLSSCSVNIHGVNGINDMDFKADKKDTVNIADLNGITGIDADISIGDCKILSGDSGKAVINISYECRAKSQEKADSGIENIDINWTTEGSTLNIEFIDKTTGKEISNSDSVNFTTNLEIYVPEDFSTFDISTEIGDIDITDTFSGSFILESDIGNINAHNINVSGKSSLTSDVGDITADILEINSDMQIIADVGNAEISVETPQKSSISVSADVGDIVFKTNGQKYEEISSSDDFSGEKMNILIAGSCNVKMTSEVGEIKIK